MEREFTDLAEVALDFVFGGDVPFEDPASRAAIRFKRRIPSAVKGAIVFELPILAHEPSQNPRFNCTEITAY